MRVFLEHCMEVGLLAARNGMEVRPNELVSGVIDQLDKIARESYPLFQVIENSDLVLHAEGPGAQHDLPWLSALNWLTSTANKNMRGLLRTMIDLMGVDGKRVAREADLRLSGLAPGSVWIGLKLMVPDSPLLPADIQLGYRLSEAAARLPMLARFIDDEGLRPGLREAEPDPAQRDAAMSSLLAFAPTGKRGIHTLGISSREYGAATLSQRERVVLQEALRRPVDSRLRAGVLQGEVREADLDKTRFHLRTADGIVRCVHSALRVDQARSMLGRMHSVSGKYETDADGRPRLMYVERIEPMPESASLL
ncbi:hypothetical protein Tharo_2135 [Thauera aromatica K172]|uniref:Uncharacterized protein n=2 Tax=Thauera aromatica TaxID=59405 RepID=A0A2R4BNY6_THAAR|nr:hypothetical protein Tharo_2135 [Thauera aromatica K172]